MPNESGDSFFIVLFSLMQYSAIVFGMYKWDIKTLQSGIKKHRSLKFNYWFHCFNPCLPLSKPLNLSVLSRHKSAFLRGL